MDKKPLVAVPLEWLKPVVQARVETDLGAEIDRLKERADVFNNFISDLMKRMERAEKAIVADEVLVEEPKTLTAQECQDRVMAAQVYPALWPPKGLGE